MESVNLPLPRVLPGRTRVLFENHSSYAQLLRTIKNFIRFRTLPQTGVCRAGPRNLGALGLFQELRLKIYKQPKNIIGKGVWASCVNGADVIGIRRTHDKDIKGLAEVVATVKEEADNLSQEDNEKFRPAWFVEDHKYMKNWKDQTLKHGYFAKNMRIENYIYNTGNLMLKFLCQGSSQNIKMILENLGYVPGFFYDAKDMMEKLSTRLGVNV